MILSNYVSALDDPSPTFKSIENYLEKMNNYTVVDTLSFQVLENIVVLNLMKELIF